MKLNTRVTLFVLLVSLLLSACGPSEEEVNATTTQIAANIYETQTAEAPTFTPTPTVTPTPVPTDTPTPTPVPTDTPTPIPTDTPTITPSPTPGLEEIGVKLSDLPPTYEELPPEVMEFYAGAGFQSFFDSSFAYTSDDPVEVVMGFVDRFESEFEKSVFDNQIQDPEILAVSMLSGFGLSSLDDENVVDYMELSDLSDIGEMSAGISLAVDQDGAILVFDLISFRQGDIGVIMMVLYPYGQEPTADVADLARKVDKRITGLFPE